MVPSSSLASTTFGADLSLTPTINISIGCGVACTMINTALSAEAPVPVASPVTGTIIRWRIKTGAGSIGNVTFRVVAPAGGGMFTGAGTGDIETTPTTATTTTFSTQLPIQAGDYVGVDSSNGQNLHAFNTSQTGANLAIFLPALADGGPPRSPIESRPNDELLVDADVAALPTSSVTVPPCSDTGQLTATVTSDPDPAVAPMAIHVRIDDGSEQVIPTIGNPGGATIPVPQGSHTLEYWGEDTVGGLESPHHTASVQVGGCATTPPTGTSPPTSSTPTPGCQDPTGAYTQGFNAGFNSGFNKAFNSGFNAAFHAGFQRGFHDGFGSTARHGRVSAAKGAPALRPQAIPAECNRQFNQGFNTAYNPGFNSGFQRGFNSGVTSGFKSGFTDGRRARHHR